MEVSGQFHVPVALAPGKESTFPLDRRLGGPRNRSWCMQWRIEKLPAPHVLYVGPKFQCANNKVPLHLHFLTGTKTKKKLQKYSSLAFSA